MKNRKSTEPRSSAPALQSAGKSEPSLGRDIRGKIGHQLRAMYDEVLAQGVPDRFRDLLDRLEQQQDKK
jgi:hypothetical protein